MFHNNVLPVSGPAWLRGPRNISPMANFTPCQSGWIPKLITHTHLLPRSKKYAAMSQNLLPFGVAWSYG